MSTDSLEKRYLYKLCANVIGLVLNMVVQGIVPRGLGPKAYGDFTFLSGWFGQLVSFLDTGTSTALYTRLSRRPDEPGLVSFYCCFLVIASLVLLLFVTAAQGLSLGSWLWPGQGLTYVYLGALFALLTWVVQVLNSMADAYGLTVRAEVARLIQRVTGLLLILLLFVSGALNLTTFFYYHYVLLFALGAVFLWIFRERGRLDAVSLRLSAAQAGSHAHQFFAYSHPLFTYSVVGVLTVLFDRWLLQVYGGSVQQGFFGLSYQIAAFSFLFTSAMTPLLTREFSIAHGAADLDQIGLLFQRFVPLFYSIAAYFSCFVALQAGRVVELFGGRSYAEALSAMQIMAFFPVHQTYGQLSGSVFLATGQTALYRNIGVICMLVGLPLTYFLVAPRARMGMDGGASGLAAKMVLLQFVTVNAQIYCNARFLKLSFRRHLWQQFASLGLLLAAAAAATLIVDRALGLHASLIPAFLVAGLLYSTIVAGLVHAAPAPFGLRRQDVSRIETLVAQSMRRRSHDSR